MEPPLFTITLLGHTVDDRVIPFLKLEWAWSDFKKGSMSIAKNTSQLIGHHKFSFRI